MGQLHKFGKKKRIYRTSIDAGHDHILKIGKVRTKNPIYYDELDQLEHGMHHHPVSYDEQGRPMIGVSEGHDHAV
jgi:hypothetical protein